MLKCNNFANVDCNKHGYMSKCVPGDPYVYSVKVWKYYLLYYEYGYNEFTTIMKKFSSRLQNTIIFPFNKNIFLKEFVSITNSLFINVFVLWIVVQTLTNLFFYPLYFAIIEFCCAILVGSKGGVRENLNFWTNNYVVYFWRKKDKQSFKQ